MTISAEGKAYREIEIADAKHTLGKVESRLRGINATIEGGPIARATADAFLAEVLAGSSSAPRPERVGTVLGKLVLLAGPTWVAYQMFGSGADTQKDFEWWKILGAIITAIVIVGIIIRRDTEKARHRKTLLEPIRDDLAQAISDAKRLLVSSQSQAFAAFRNLHELRIKAEDAI